MKLAAASSLAPSAADPLLASALREVVAGSEDAAVESPQPSVPTAALVQLEGESVVFRQAADAT